MQIKLAESLLDMTYAMSYDFSMSKTTILTPSQARANLYNVINQASAGTTEFLIQSKNGKTAVLLSQDELESWRETAEILMTPGAQKSILTGKKEVLEGKVIPISEI